MVRKNVNISLDSDVMAKVETILESKQFEDFRIRAELDIMHQVLETEGNNILEKIDNYNEICEKGCECVKNNNYKIKHRGIYGKV